MTSLFADPKKSTTMNALVFVVFALLFFTLTVAHTDHLIDHTSNLEQQGCYICHQGIDTPPELPAVAASSVGQYYLLAQQVISLPFSVTSYVTPQLRAPPVFS